MIKLEQLEMEDSYLRLVLLSNCVTPPIGIETVLTLKVVGRIEQEILFLFCNESWIKPLATVLVDFRR